MFSFHGERKDVEWNTLGGVVDSLDDWKVRLKDGKIFDEYGREVPVFEFLTLVEAKRDEKNSHALQAMSGEWGAQYAGTCWVDNEGNSFNDGEFS